MTARRRTLGVAGALAGAVLSLGIATGTASAAPADVNFWTYDTGSAAQNEFLCRVDANAARNLGIAQDDVACREGATVPGGVPGLWYLYWDRDKIINEFGPGIVQRLYDLVRG
jgi:hypothetical protein